MSDDEQNTLSAAGWNPEMWLDGIGKPSSPATLAEDPAVWISIIAAAGVVGGVNALIGGASSSTIINSTNQSLVPYYPPNNGFLPNPVNVTLDIGTVINRIGNLSGRYAFPPGTPVQTLSLPPATTDLTITALKVVQPIPNVLYGQVAPWYGELGYGTQYFFGFNNILGLIEKGFLEIIK